MERTLYDDMSANIERCGRTIIAVGGIPPFAYSIGNSVIHSLPELIVLGLAPSDAMPLINAWSSLMIERGSEFADRELIDIGGAFPCRAVHCRPEVRDNYTIQAGRYLGHQDYRVTQIIIPDPEGRFPDDPLCAPPYRLFPDLSAPPLALFS